MYKDETILILLHARILSFTCESGPFADGLGSSARSDLPWLRACINIVLISFIADTVSVDVLFRRYYWPRQSYDFHVST